MTNKVKMLKEKINAGEYDIANAIETLAEKAVIVNEIFGSVWGISF